MLLYLHPSARLIIALLLMMLIQAAPFFFLVGLGILLLLSPSLHKEWYRLFRRTRFLLISLFLIFAYGSSAPPVFNISALPSIEGLQEGGLHAIRLTLLLGVLSWLLVPLDTRSLMGGLWYLLHPLKKLGIPVDKSVIRLALVLEYMEETPGQGWKEWLGPATVEKLPVAAISIKLPVWLPRDSLSLVIFTLLLASGVWLQWHGSP